MSTFPLQEFLDLHARPWVLGDADDMMRDLFPLASLPPDTPVYYASTIGCEGGRFDFQQDGPAQPSHWQADAVVMLNDQCAILLSLDKPEARTATMLMVDTISSATFRPAPPRRELTHVTDDS